MKPLELPYLTWPTRTHRRFMTWQAFGVASLLGARAAAMITVGMCAYLLLIIFVFYR